MLFRNFLIKVVVQIILIALTGLLVLWSFTRENLFVARFTFIMIWILLIGSLINYVTKTNRTLKAFMESLRYLDTVSTQKGKGRSFEELDILYNEIIGIIRKVETERITDRLYFRSIIEHAGVGIISFDESGEVESINAAFRKIMGIRSLKNISGLSMVSEQLPGLLVNLKPGRQKLVRLTVDGATVSLALKTAEFRLSGRKVRLVSVQNIQHELEDEELDAWQKLIQVLTHEIMNSVTPVNSLTNTIIRMFESNGQQKSIGDLDDAVLKNALEGLHSIEKRNRGLIGFVQSYRSLTRIKKPAFTEVSVADLLGRVSTLAGPAMETHGIRLSLAVQGNDLHLTADEKLVEQVLINLINNAVQALQETTNPEISIVSRIDHDELCIGVRDNGPGIPQDIMQSIFIPFFTTKKEGSGIGLSLSRQIMRLHGGSITVSSGNDDTEFVLKFPVNV
jgi:nitrogen fixation/metabolism regulation signal transduction histidine kinase